MERPAAHADGEGVRLRIPGATYRLQFNQHFTFRDAAALVPYLADLGITDIYASSYLKAVPGSLHGYDVADPTTLNPEVGTEADYEAYLDVLRQHGLGQLLDVVPNHMGIARGQNRWWLDVLENGPASRYARFFDIDWRPIKRELEGKVLLPFLGDQYGAVLERGEIQLELRDGSFRLHYFETELPLAPKSFVRILSHRIDTLSAELGEEHPHLQELQSIITGLRRLPERSETLPELVVERTREKEVSKRRIAALVRESEPVRAFLDENVRQFNGTAGDPRSFDLLDALLNDQAYRLAHWRVAAEEINYRRFFDINELAAIRTEDPGVFEQVHELIFQLVRRGAVTGLRIDHVDGMYDPADYLNRLQQWARAQAPGATSERPLYVVVEKILGPGEPLPDWPVYGTTGYEFLNHVNALFVERANARVFEEIYERFTGEPLDFEDLVYLKKKQVMMMSMASEINVLAQQLNRFSERNRHFRDFTLYSLLNAIRETIACFPVYRTYVSEAGVSERDARYIQQASDAARRRNPALNRLVFTFIRDLLLKRADYIPESERDEHLRFVMKFQQTTSPVTAKGVEDTALYIYNRLVSLNEVSGEPTIFGLAPPALHQWMAERQREWPHALSATSTHDTKRSEDVRARINVLSEVPEQWKAALGRWSHANRRRKHEVEGRTAPSRNEEYLLYQTLVGTYPVAGCSDEVYADYIARIQQYMVKAMREAKVHTSWLNPSDAYEEAVSNFVAALLARSPDNKFLEDFTPFAQAVARYGLWNGLSQVTLKIMAPGVPDFYQGAELWEFTLVDPDNRRPVDYARRREMLSALDAQRGEDGTIRHEVLQQLLEHRGDGRCKLLLVSSLLRFRRDHRALFLEGDYHALETRGARAPHAFAFSRRTPDTAVVVVVPRLIATLLPDPAQVPAGEVWGDATVELPPASGWRNVLTGDRLPGADQASLADVLARFPVAVLESE